MRLAGLNVRRLTWILAAVTGAQDVKADPSALLFSADPARQGQIVEEALGVKVVALARDEMPLPDSLAATLQGGLRVTTVVGALAKAATLEPGDTIVRIGDVTVTDTETALRGVRETQAQNWITIQIVRGTAIRNVELLIAPQFAEGAHPGLSWPDRVALASFDRAESVQRVYRQKCQLLADELIEIERLQHVLGVKDITDPTSIIRKREEFEEQSLAQNARQAEVIESHLATLNAEVERRGRVADAHQDARLRALVEKQRALTQMLAEITKKRDDAPARLEAFRQDVLSLASRHDRVRILVRAIEGLRTSQRQGTD